MRKTLAGYLFLGPWLLAGLPASAQTADLGSLTFPTSCAKAAQPHFERGVLALHSFWFEEALAAFQETTKADPRCVMGYWGEAMAHNHPLWAEQDTEAARAVMAKVSDLGGITQKERDWWDALKALYGDGDKLARDKAYSAAMERMYRAYPGDLEVATFYALSLLGTVRPGDKGFSRQMEAGAIALDVFARNPNHPGAAHFVIHAFDDPEHAILALPAAFRYAKIAPEAHHARHMPSHIFIQRGMWPEAEASNISAWEASVNWVKRKNLSPARQDLHSLHWWMYVALQEGKFVKAQELLDLRNQVAAAAEKFGSDSAGPMRTGSGARYSAYMHAALVAETEAWPRAKELFPVTVAKAPAAAGTEHVHGAAPPASNYSQMETYGAFIRGLAAAKSGSPEAEREMVYLKEGAQKSAREGDGYYGRFMEVMALSVEAQLNATRGSFDRAIELMQRATKIEEGMSPPSGPPDLIKPSHELLGEILLKAGKSSEAQAQFEIALQRQPNRARSLLGAARAAKASGKVEVAGAYYERLSHVWKDADQNLAELREVQDAVKNAAVRAGQM